MREEKIFTIVAGSMQDAQTVVNHVWEQTRQPMNILERICRLRELVEWEEYSETAIPFVLKMTETAPCSITEKYPGRSGGRTAHLYADVFAQTLQMLYDDQLACGMETLCHEDDEEDEDAAGGENETVVEKNELEGA